MPKQPYVDTPLSNIFRWERTPRGDVGIEVEIEGGPWPEAAIPNWIVHQDGSLRNGGIEYVIRQPIVRDNIRRSVQTLADGLERSNKVFSWRTSVHVHINVQDMTIRQWVNFVALFCIFEEAAVNVVGPLRAGNKFCLRFKDADESLRCIRGGIRNQALREYLRGDLKYASANIKATVTHGTLEFRAMQGNLDVEFISDWSLFLLALKDAAKAAASPCALCEEMSALGAIEFANKYLPRDNRITTGILAQPNFTDTIYEGVRLAQDVAYCTDWDKPAEPVAMPGWGEPLAPAFDPFEPNRHLDELVAMAAAPPRRPVRMRAQRVDANNIFVEAPPMRANPFLRDDNF